MFFSAKQCPVQIYRAKERIDEEFRRQGIDVEAPKPEPETKKEKEENNK